MVKTIDYMNSEDVTASSQLKEIFRDHCGIMINGIIFTSKENIIVIKNIISVESDELNRIYKLAIQI